MAAIKRRPNEHRSARIVSQITILENTLKMKPKKGKECSAEDNLMARASPPAPSATNRAVYRVYSDAEMTVGTGVGCGT